MRTKLLLIASLLFIGCSKNEPKPVPVDPEPVVPVEKIPSTKVPEVKKEEVKPEKTEPVEPISPKQTPSTSFLNGYRDGYTGTWLGPFKWSFNPEYRHGWAVGKKDRKAKRSPRYSLD